MGLVPALKWLSGRLRWQWVYQAVDPHPVGPGWGGAGEQDPTHYTGENT